MYCNRKLSNIFHRLTDYLKYIIFHFFPPFYGFFSRTLSYFFTNLRLGKAVVGEQDERVRAPEAAEKTKRHVQIRIMRAVFSYKYVLLLLLLITTYCIVRGVTVPYIYYPCPRV